MYPTNVTTIGSLATQPQPTLPRLAVLPAGENSSTPLSPMFGHSTNGTDGRRQCVSLTPAHIFRNLPHIGYGQDFKVFEPLVDGQQLNLWQKAVLSPIWLYQKYTRHNSGKSGQLLRKAFQSDSCAFPHTHEGRGPSCSEYTALAIKYFGQTGLIGTLKGCLYGVWRIAHCNPWLKSDIISGKYQDPNWVVCLPKDQAALWQKPGVDISA